MTYLKLKELEKAREQSQSLLFGLPTELRFQIYSSAFPIQSIHISCQRKEPSYNGLSQRNELTSIPCQLADNNFADGEKVTLNSAHQREWGAAHESCYLALSNKLHEQRTRNLQTSASNSLVPKRNPLPFVHAMLTCRRLLVLLVSNHSISLRNLGSSIVIHGLFPNSRPGLINIVY
jgi:hypothetical protein